MNHTIIRLAVLFIIIAINPFRAVASHAAGGEISYEWISDSTYRVYFKFYRDCTGAAEPANNTILLCYRNTCNSQGGTVFLNKITTLPDSTVNGSPVTLGCPGNGTRCTNSTSTVPGYREWWYMSTVTLPSRCNFWRFSVAIGNRNASINLVNAQNTVFYAEATLNNLAAQGNSSPYFSVKPVPSICINQPYTYNNGGVDPNSDSLRFEMVQPQQTNGACPPTTSTVTYVSTTPAYNLTTNPIACNNTFALDSATGQMTFTPNTTGASTMTVRIKEYRNGVLIGTVMRDIQVQVIACTVTAPIVNTVSATVSGGNLVNGRVEACAGVPLSFCYDLKSSDTAAILVANDNHTSAAPGSVVTYVGQYTDSIRGCFYWTPSTVDTGLRVFSVTAKDSTCVSPGVVVAQTFVLPIYIWPITDIIKDTTICYGDSTLLTAVGGSNFTWSVLPGGSPITSLSCTTCKQPYAKPSITTQYRVTNSAVQYCSKNSDTVTVTVTDIRYDTLAATSNSPICQGDTLKLYATTAPAGSGYKWTGPGGFTSTLQNPVIPGTPLSGAGNYILKSSKGLCFSFPDTTVAVVNPRPSPPVLSNNGPLCTGSTLNLSATTIAGATYTWSGPNSFSSSSQNPSISNAQQINSGTYNAYTTLNGCTSTTTGSTVATITNKPVIVPSSANAVVCGGKGSITLGGLLSSTTYQLDYKKNGVTQTTTSVASNAGGNIVMSNLDTATYSQIRVTINGCSSDTIAPIIIIQPSKPVITSISSNTPICQGDTLRLFATSDSSAVTWSWTGPNSFISTTQSPVIPNAATAASGTYVLTATINNCISNPDSTIVLVKPKPATPDASNNGPLCSGDTLHLVSTTVSGATYSWTGPNSFTSSNQNPNIPNVDTLRSGNYIIRATINGCLSNADTTIVVINHKPHIDSFAYTDLTACYAMDGKIFLYGFVPGKLFIVNYKKDGSPEPPAPYYSDLSGIITMTGLDTGTYSQIKVSFQGCLSDTIAPIRLQNPPTPTVSTATNNTPICAGDTLRLFATTSASGVAWSWTGPNSYTTSSQNPVIPNALTNRSGVYSVTVTLLNCTSPALTTTVVVNPIPDTPDAANNGPLCSGDTLHLTSATVAGATYAWSGPHSYTSSSQNPNRVNADTAMTGNYIVVATVNGCVSVADTTAVIVYQTPSIDSFSYSNPTTCSGTEGSITLKGLLGSTLYAVNYKKNGVAQTPLSITSTASGRVVMSSLNEAVYSQIRVTLNGCTSDTIIPVSLIGPVKPVITTINNNTPICQGDTIKLSAASDSTGVVWSWAGPLSYSSAAQNPVILSAVPAQSGTYVLTVTKNNCTSFSDSTIVVVKPTPDTPVAGSNTPVCSGDTLQLTATTVTGATYSWTGPNSYASSSQNPSRLSTDTTMTGNYIVAATINGCVSVPDTAAVIIYHTPSIDSTSSANPTTCLGTQGFIILKGLTANTTYTVNYKKNGVTQTPLSIASNGTGQVTMNGLSAAAYTLINVTLNGCTSNSVGPIFLRDPGTPVVTANNNSPICQGDTLRLFATSDTSGVVWSWTGPSSFTSSLQNPVLANSVPAQSGLYTLTASKNGCTSIAATTGVLVRPTPPTPIATSNSPVCSGNSLLLNASAITNASYNWTGPNSYTSTAQNPGIPNVDTQITGNYIVIATVDGCVSAADTAIVVVYHTPSIDSFYYSNPTTCNGPQGTLTLTGLQNNTAYTVNYTRNGILQVPLNRTTNSSGLLLVNGLYAGSYSLVSVTLNGCTSDTIAPFVLTDPSAPVILSATNNTPICEGDTIKLYATSDSLGVTWAWNGPPAFFSPDQNPVLTGASPAQSGAYTVTATKNGCVSATDTTIVLVKPTPATPVASSNTPVCSGNTLLLNSSTVLNASYNWTGPNSYTSTIQNPSITNVDTQISGNYIVIATVNGCISTPDTATVVVYHTPSIDSFSYGNPTTCAGTEGSITLKGMVRNVTYVVNYKKNGVTQTAWPIVSTVSGRIVMNALSAGTYSQIRVTLNGCTSDTIAPIVLTDPSAPVVLSATNNTPICESDTIRLFATSDSTGVTWLWTGPPAFSSTSQNPIITGAVPAQSGIYTVTAFKNGCTSIAGTTTVLVKPTPATPVATSNSPVCSGNNLLLNSSTVLNASYNWTGPNSYTSAIQNPSITNVDTQISGNYIVIATVNGCVSAPDTAIVVVYHTPSIDSFSYSNPTTCAGTEGSITLKGMVRNVTYTVNYKKNGVLQAPLPIVSSPTGRVVMTGLGAFTYSQISATLNGCTSDTITPITLIDPTKPVITSISNNTPICESDTIKLFATSDSSGVTWSWSGPPAFFSSLQNPIITNAVPAQSGAYTLTASKNGCISAMDTTIVLVKPTPATPDANNNSPLCSGDTLHLTATTVAGASYNWRGPNSYTAVVQNPNRANVDTFMTGNYIVTATINGCVSAADTTAVIIYHTPAIDSFSYSNPITCAGTEGSIILKGMVRNVTYSVNYKKNGVTQAAWPVLSSATGRIVMSGLGAGTYSQIRVTLNGCTSDTITPIILTDPSKPVILSISNNTPICQSDTIKLFATSDSTGVTWSWTGPGGYTSALQNPMRLNAQPAQSGNYILTIAKNNCISIPDTTIVLVKPTPDTPHASNNSPICSGNTLLLFADTVSNASYIWSGPLSFASANRNPSVPNATISMTGTYTVVATVNGCASASSSTNVTVYILPAPSISSFAITNPTTCGGANGSVVIGGLQSSTTYILNYRKNGNAQTPTSITTSIVGSFVITGLTAGVYSNLTVTSPNGCVSDPLSPFTLTDPIPPVITFDRKTNPTTCLGNEGTITVAGLIASSSYFVNYDKGITPQPTVAIAADAFGKVTITGLTAGTYNNIRVTINNCVSNDIDSIVLTDPNAPVITATNNTPICQGETIALYGTSDSTGVTWSWTGPLGYNSNVQNPVITSAMPTQSGSYVLTATKHNCTSLTDTTIVLVKPTPPTPVAGSNSPVCSGDTLFLTASTVANAAYSWSGPASFSALIQNPNRSNADTFMSGKYYVYVIVNGCESLRDTATVIIHQTPAITNSVGANPTTCNGSDGTITLYGQLPNTTYIVNYTKNGTAQPPVSILSTGAGEVVLTGLTKGNYTRITVSLNNCPSDTTALIMLGDPRAPVITVSNNSPICQGDTLRLYGLSDSSSVAWSWVGPAGFTSSVQNPVMASAMPVMSGVYTLTVTKNNCISLPASTSVTVYPTPPTPVTGSNTPVCSNDSIKLTSSTVAGAIYSWTGPKTFSSSQQNPSISPADTFMNGYYRLHVFINGCSSLFDSTYVTVYQTPVIDSYSYSHPTTCGGIEGTITLKGLKPNTTYTINARKNSVPLAPVSASSNGTGILVYTGLSAGLYTKVSVTLNGCVSNFVDSVLLKDPLKPVVNATNNTPICQDDTIKLFGTSDSTGVTWSWTGPLGYVSSIQNPVITNALPSQSGVYTLTATKNNCTSLPDTTTVTVKPTPATPVAGSNSPVCSGRTLNLTSTTVTNATYSWTGPLLFTSVIQNPNITNVDTPASGDYIVIATVNGCVSAADTTTVIVYKTPVIGGYTFTHPLTCGGTTGTITLNGLKINTTYTVNTKKNGVPMSASVSSNGTGQAVVTGLTAGAYSQLTVTLNNCPSDTLPVIVLKDPGAPSVTATNNTPICAQDTIKLYGLSDSTGVTWSWTGPSGYTSTLQNPIITTALPFQSGNYILTATKNNCVSVPDTTIVVVHPKPIPTLAGNNGPLCTGNTLILTAATRTGAIYSWTGPNSFTSSLQNPNKVNVGLIDSGKYIVKVMVNGCWSDPDTTTVVIYRTPTISGYSFTHPTTCGGTNGTITINGLNNNTTYAINYKKNGTAQPTMPVLSNGTGQVVMTGLGAGVYTQITAGLNNCPSDTLVPITLRDPRAPVITSISNNTPICQGDTIKLFGTSDSSGVTWSWTGPLAYTSTLQNPTILNAVPTQSGVYTLTATKNNCTSTGATTTVTVKPTPPTPVAGNNGPLCDSSTLLLSASTIANGKYAWTGPLFFTDTAQNPIIIKAAVNRSGIYIVTVTVNGCKSLPDTTTVVINPIPAAPVPTTPVVYCEEDIAINLQAVGANLLWYTTATGGTGSSIAPIPSTTTAGTYVWYVSQTVNNCESPRAMITVTIKPKPVKPIVSPKTYLYCQYDNTMPLNATGTNLLWYTQAVGGTGNSATPVPSSAASGIFNWYVSQTNAVGCESNRDTVTVTIRPELRPDIVADKISICLNDTITMADSGKYSTKVKYIWDFKGGNVLSGDSSGPYVVTWNMTGTKKVVLNVTNDVCTGNDTISIEVHAIPEVSFDVKDEACADEEVQLNLKPVANATYTWTYDDGELGGSATGGYHVRWHYTGKKTVSLLVTSEFGCKSPVRYDNILIHENPSADIASASRQDICQGDTISVLARFEDKYKYEWGGKGYYLSKNNNEALVQLYESGSVVVKATNEWGCTDEDSIYINARPCCDMFMPDAFTPNGDGRNDIFRILSDGNHDVYTFIIVNRWGQRVFETTNEKQGWDGNFKGVPQEIGTYHYYIKYRCSNNSVLEKKGQVVLVR